MDLTPALLTDYQQFLQHKQRVFQGAGIAGDYPIPSQLYGWQRAIVRWAVKKGRAAIFADCGLGKSFMQVAWAEAIGQRTLLLAPLCVAEQTVGEAHKLDIPMAYARTQAEADATGLRLTITNYERLDAFDATAFGAVVLDESSILKSFDGKTRSKLIQAFRGVRYRLCCTATPSPNDIAELANHAEFLGLMTRAEFLATWFVHDDAGWRMKKHAVEPFYRWLASWAIAFRRPSDLGYDDTGYDLPPLTIHETIVDGSGDGESLFPELGLKGIGGRLRARRGSLQARVDATANLIHERGVSWIVWCGLNTESEALAAMLPRAVELCGSDSYAEKVSAIQGFCGGTIRKLVTKAKIAGFGLNLQHCSHMAFVGLSDSYETYYQCIRRCWRFGQQKPVAVHIVVSDAERGIVENVRRKEATADTMRAGMLAHMRDFEREELSV